ncbi:MAG: DUF3524 domain-containing protein [Gammaproteobacteria bacterium]|nr:DUF3524 domain-containing protein [Gammaproteobacteria bacterium]
MDPAKPSRILLLSAYDAASHRRWREQLTATLSAYHWQVLALPPRHFRWRIRGNALSWLEEPAMSGRWDLVVATSMVDLAVIKGFFPGLASTPSVLYMHENQFAYPTTHRQHTSAEPRMVNLSAAVAADVVLFNSAWNLESFLDGVNEFLDRMPDAVPRGLLDDLRNKSQVLPVPVEDHLFMTRESPLDTARPHLLWNHRWEYDKGPERLLSLLEALENRGLDFRLSVVGEQFRSRPPAFAAIRERHGRRLVHWGFMERRSDYDALLARADVVLSTALHDFQGLSMLEAMAAGCLALAPHRLAYPEYVPAAQLYESHPHDPQREAEAAAACLMGMLRAGEQAAAPEAWRLSRLASRYGALFEEVMRGGTTSPLSTAL